MSGKKNVRKKTLGFIPFALIVSLALNAYFLLPIIRTSFLTNSSETGEQVRVSRVIDGDTFDTDDGRRVRLALVDAPEYQEECYSYESREHLKSLADEKQVSFKTVDKDNFGREVAFVFVSGQLVQSIMLREGSVLYVAGRKASEYDVELIRAEKQAKALGRGLWSSACQNRKDPDCNIKANVRRQDRTKIYHLPECLNYDRIVINEKKGDRWFCIEREAIEAGFVKSGNCP